MSDFQTFPTNFLHFLQPVTSQTIGKETLKANFSKSHFQRNSLLPCMQMVISPKLRVWNWFWYHIHVTLKTSFTNCNCSLLEGSAPHMLFKTFQLSFYNELDWLHNQNKSVEKILKTFQLSLYTANPQII